MLGRFQAAASQIRRVTSGITLLPDVNPNNGLALDVFVPVILEEDFSTRPFLRTSSSPAAQVPVETDYLLRSDKLSCPLDRDFYGVAGSLPLPAFHGSTTCVFASPHGLIVPQHGMCHEAARLQSRGCRPSPDVNILCRHPLTLTAPRVMPETGSPGVQPQHGQYVRTPRLPVMTPASPRTVDEGLLPPVIMQFGDVTPPTMTPRNEGVAGLLQYGD